MDLKSGYPFWAVKNGLMHAFPPLRRDLRCEVAVVGGGISGALIADTLARHGHDVALFEQRDIGWGSTAASTALIQYEIDTHMTDLAERFGEDAAAAAYLACADAIDAIAELARDARDAGFARVRSLYFASRLRHRKPLQAEYAMRARHGLDVEWLDAGDADSRFRLDTPGAILSGKAAILDPYRLTYRLLSAWQRRGMAVHDRVSLVRFTPRPRSVELEMDGGCRVIARHLVLATGYAAQEELPRGLARNHSSYAFVTDPLQPGELGEWARTMLWETARPYLYMRPSSDGRLLVGGEDDAIDIPPLRDARVDRKARKLAKRVAGMFPWLPVQPAFSWAGTFAETPDGLPYFGAHPRHGPRVLFAMPYGGNGITYSAIGAGILLAAIERRGHPLSGLFGFGRAA